MTFEDYIAGYVEFDSSAKLESDVASHVGVQPLPRMRRTPLPLT